MVAFTTARGLYQVANSSYVGTWDVPENSNWGVVDAALGQITTIQLNNTPVTLTAGQAQCFQIIFSSSAAPGGNLAGNVVVTFPTVVPSSTELTGPYVIQNLCGNSSLFTVTIQTTVAGGQVVACKPGEPFDVINDGTNFKFKNMGHVGSLWDYVGSSVPNWVTACTIPPYLNGDGATFSSAVYPALASIMGTTLPDLRGRYRATLNQTTTRITSSGGVDGNTIFAAGGSMLTISASMIPLMGSAVSTAYFNDPGHSHPGTWGKIEAGGGWGSQAPANETASTIPSAQTGITIGSSIPATATLPPSVIFGITMIRSA